MTSEIPWLSTLGNGDRVIVVSVLAMAVVIACLSMRSRRSGVLLMGGLVLLTGLGEKSDLRFSAVHNDSPEELWSVIDGPTVTWPDGDPPLWNPGAYPKEGLWMAASHGGPQSFDFGRANRRPDEALLVRLSEVALLPLGRGAAETIFVPDDHALFDEVRDRGFTRLFVYFRPLSAKQEKLLEAYLLPLLGPPLRRTQGGAVWAL